MEFLTKRDIMEAVLRTYIFDWDDNVVIMPTKIRMDKRVNGKWHPIDVTTKEYAKIRGKAGYRFRNDSLEEAFVDFRDDNSFMRDLHKAINDENFGPSFNDFKKALIGGHHFALNSARGHSPSALLRGCKYLVERVFTDDEKKEMEGNIRRKMELDDSYSTKDVFMVYFTERGEYYGVNSPQFAEEFSADDFSLEKRKQVAMDDFVRKVKSNVSTLIDKGYKRMSVGFSDDDIHNVNSMIEYIEDELHDMYPHIRFVVYDTSSKGKSKIVVEKD